MHDNFSLWAIIFLSAITALPAENFDTEKTYRNAQFISIVDHLEKKDESKLTQHEKLLLIECLARTARGYLALEKMKPLLVRQSPGSEILATAGILYSSLGRLQEAQKYIDQALALDNKSVKAILAKVMLLLYLQQYPAAEHWYEKFIERNPAWIDSNLFYFTGLEVYTGTRNAPKLKELYNQMARKYKKIDYNYYQNLKANVRLYHKAVKGQLFEANTKTPRVLVPFGNQNPASSKKTIFLQSKGQKFKVVLDTGNAVGWMVHSRTLKDILKANQGGRALTRLGTEASNLYGYRIHARKVPFHGFTISHLVGQYVPKPRPDFYDANLNPIFIRNRVITLDFIHQQMVLSTKEGFDDDLSSRQEENLVKLPWYGYEHVLIPVTIKGIEGLAMIETGAEDIALKLDFARMLNLPLKKEKRYLANGEVFIFHKTSVQIFAGNFCFAREEAEVWPLDRFFNPIVGLTPDVVIGPSALEGKYIVSFDPFNRQVILRYEN